MAYFIFSDGTPLDICGHTPKDAREVSRAEYLRADKAHALKRLREIIPVKSTIYCTLKHLAPSGMSRTIDFLIPLSGERDGKPWADDTAAKFPALDYTPDEEDSE